MASERQPFGSTPGDSPRCARTSSISDKGEVLPFRFTADPPDVPYQSVVVMLSPGDWNRRNELAWPDGFERLEKVA